ncbi:hypothetical protein FACS1894167_11910 [Synergistales bacterium]|nr:hypothetical protein FACS1894167_11910 [Synergistales bacterium]
MSSEESGDDVRLAVEWVRNRASPCNKSNAYVYAKVVHVAFDEIKALRADNFRLIDICKGFEESGLLPQGSKPCNLGKALKREDVRRRKRISDKSSGGVKSGTIAKAVPKAVDKTPSPDMTDEEKAEKARLKKLGLHPVDIGNGVRKLPGGGFSF